MNFSSSLIPGTCIRRYKRFLVDVELEDGSIITAHCPNSGRMTSCLEPGWRVLLTHTDNPKRKLKYTLELSHNGHTWICANTHRANQVAKEALENQKIKELSSYKTVQPEVKVENSRIDFLLQSEGLPDCYVEVKSVTLLHPDGHLCFPDAVTTRGQKHLQDLITLQEKGFRTALLFLIMREDGSHFSAAEHIDPVYSKLLKQAQSHQVEILAYRVETNPQSLTISSSNSILLT